MMKSAGAGPASSSPHSHHIRKQHGQSIFNCRSCLVVLFFLAFVAILYGEDVSCALRQAYSQPPQPAQQQQKRPQKLVPEGQDQKVFDHSYERDLPFAVGDEEGAGARLGGCDVFSGRWVYDPSSRPQYQEDECPYIQPQLTCLEHGRPERSHQYWRWQPHGCSLPSFNATFMLEKLRGKRVLYVGDSLNRGQFVSMVCLLHRVILESAKSMETFDSLTVFTAKDYNATIEFYWAPFLVESNSDNAVIHRVTDRIVRAGAIEKHAKNWKGADVVVFNTYLWWMTGQKMKILRGSFTDEQTKNDIQLMETEDAYRLALRSMIGWVEKNIDPKASRVFFASMSPSHEKGTGWGGEPGSNCYNQTSPIFDPSYWGSADVNIMRALTEELGKASPVSVTLLNITQLSEYRKDAHTSIYKKQWSPLTPEQIANPRSYADCVHWCLPGLQDTWNELLYAKLFFP